MEIVLDSCIHRQKEAKWWSVWELKEPNLNSDLNRLRLILWGPRFCSRMSHRPLLSGVEAINVELSRDSCERMKCNGEVCCARMRSVQSRVQCSSCGLRCACRFAAVFDGQIVQKIFIDEVDYLQICIHMSSFRVQGQCLVSGRCMLSWSLFLALDRFTRKMKVSFSLDFD